jgi:hypothetical protein
LPFLSKGSGIGIDDNFESNWTGPVPPVAPRFFFQGQLKISY